MKPSNVFILPMLAMILKNDAYYQEIFMNMDHENVCQDIHCSDTFIFGHCGLCDFHWI